MLVRVKRSPDPVTASLISFSIFAYCTIVGFALQAWLLRSRRKAQILLSPALGAGFAVMVVLFINRLGIAIERFAIPVALLMLALAFVAYVRAPGSVNWKPYWPFAAIILVAFVLNARPLFDYDLNFLSYGNDDMVNYVLGAERIVEHGYSDIPDQQQIVFNRDPPLPFWVPFIIDNERSGSEVLLATVISVTGLNGFRIFMPTIFSFGLMVICATCGLVYQKPENRGAAILTGAFLAVSAETTLGIAYQLIAQVFGLAMLAASFALTLRILGTSWRNEWPSFVLAGISIAALGVVYPEVVPFFVLALVTYMILGLLRHNISARAAVSSLGIATLIAIVFLNGSIRIPLSVLLTRVIGASSVADVAVTPFPFFLYPSGVPNLFGILPVDFSPGPVVVSAAILLGFVLLAALLAAIAYGVWELEATAFIAGIMLVLGISLFDHRNGFGLYKLAMYMQPFIWGTFATAVMALFRRGSREAQVASA